MRLNVYVCNIPKSLPFRMSTTTVAEYMCEKICPFYRFSYVSFFVISTKRNQKINFCLNLSGGQSYVSRKKLNSFAKQMTVEIMKFHHHFQNNHFFCSFII